MEEQKAETAVAEAQVGPTSEQLTASSPTAAPQVGQGQDTVASPKMQEFAVPTEHRAAVEVLALEENEWDIRVRCANARRRKAMDEGDAEKAIIEFRNLINAGKAHDVAKATVQSEIRLIIPGIPADGNIHLEMPSFNVRWYQET